MVEAFVTQINDKGEEVGRERVFALSLVDLAQQTRLRDGAVRLVLDVALPDQPAFLGIRNFGTA